MRLVSSLHDSSDPCSSVAGSSSALLSPRSRFGFMKRERSWGWTPILHTTDSVGTRRNRASSPRTGGSCTELALGGPCPAPIVPAVDSGRPLTSHVAVVLLLPLARQTNVMSWGLRPRGGHGHAQSWPREDSGSCAAPELSGSCVSSGFRCPCTGTATGAPAIFSSGSEATAGPAAPQPPVGRLPQGVSRHTGKQLPSWGP